MSVAPPVELLSRFRAVIAQGLGLTVEETRLDQLEQVLVRRAGLGKLSAQHYVERIERTCEPGELGALARALTVGETYFFRNAEQFEALRSIVLREYAEPGRPGPRVLSAGCSSGEEPYSIAMLLREILPEREPSIVAIDVNTGLLDRARAGRYSTWSLREMPSAAIHRWLTPESNEFALAEPIRRAVGFTPGNLAQEEPELLRPQAYDVIFCRNVLMYFTPEQRRRALQRLTGALAHAGYFFLGSAETLRGESHDFHLCHTHGAFYYRRKGAAKPSSARPLPLARAPALGFTGDPLAPVPVPSRDAGESAAGWFDDIGRAAARIEALARRLPEPARLEPARIAPQATGLARSELRAPLELLHAERFGQALEHVRALPAHAAQDPDTLLLEAVLLASDGKLEQAEQSVRRLLEQDELNAGAHYVLALCAAGNGALAEAVRNDRIAIYLDPGFAMPHLHLGLMLRKSGEPQAASRELARARALLEREDSARILLFGGGFGRPALLELCAAELAAVGASR